MGTFDTAASRTQALEKSGGMGSSSHNGLMDSTAAVIWMDVRKSYSQWQCTMMSYFQPIASRQFSKPFRMFRSSSVVSRRFDRSRALSVAGCECGKPNLNAVQPAGEAF